MESKLFKIVKELYPELTDEEVRRLIEKRGASRSDPHGSRYAGR